MHLEYLDISTAPLNLIEEGLPNNECLQIQLMNETI